MTAAGVTRHWPEYLMESALLAMFMISACAFTVLVMHPSSPVHQSVESPLARRFLIGITMGATAVGLIYSPWGQRSGAHMNPSITLGFLFLGKVARWDAFFYIAAQFAGGVAGVAVASLLIGPPLGHSAVDYVVTLPGPAGPVPAFVAELLISWLMMSAVLVASNRKGLARFTGLFAGALIAAFVTLEAPLSGMSMNPARTFGSAAAAREWTALWLYFTAPPLGMLAAALVFRIRRGAHAALCAKLHHENNKRCIFRCNYGATQRSGVANACQ